MENTKNFKDIVTDLIDAEWMEQKSRCGLTYGEIQELDRISYEQMAYEEMLSDCK